MPLSSFAAYQPIPESKSNEYKIGVELIIDKETPLVKKSIKRLFNEIKKENNAYNRQLLVEQGIPTILFEFYQKLINTTNEYTKISDDLPNTDWYEELQSLLGKYFKENHIDERKLNALLKYANRKQLQLKKKYGNY